MTTDLTHAADAATVGAAMQAVDRANWHAHAHVDKYDDEQVAWVCSRAGIVFPVAADFERLNVRPADTADASGNLVTTAGWTRFTSLMVGAGGQALTNTATRIGVGNSSTAAAIGQTDLQAAAGAANRYFMTMDATFPSAATNVITAKASFATGDGNFVWSEWCMDIGTPTVAASAVVNATMVNRKVDSLGTKASGVWALTSTISFS